MCIHSNLLNRSPLLKFLGSEINIILKIVFCRGDIFLLYDEYCSNVVPFFNIVKRGTINCFGSVSAAEVRH